MIFEGRELKIVLKIDLCRIYLYLCLRVENTYQRYPSKNTTVCAQCINHTYICPPKVFVQSEEGFKNKVSCNCPAHHDTVVPQKSQADPTSLSDSHLLFA